MLSDCGRVLALLFKLQWLLRTCQGCNLSDDFKPRLPPPVTAAPATTDQPITSPPPVFNFGRCGHSQYVNDGEDPADSTWQYDGSDSSSSNFSSVAGIIAGTVAQQNEFPWQAFLNIYDSAVGISFLCGGSLISSQWIITAAHCCNIAKAASDISVNLGGNYLLGEFTVRTPATAMFPHLGYNSTNQNYDICLLKIPQVTINSWSVFPICLPQSCSSTCQSGEVAVITGWGMTSQGGMASMNLNRGLVPITTREACAAKYPSLTENQLCAGWPEGGTDACNGDSGGPLACLKRGAFYLDGITSYGYGCGQPGSPGVYTRVCKQLDWILLITSNN